MPSQRVLKILYGILEVLASCLQTGKIPSIKVPSRAKGNLVFDETAKVWVLGPKKTLKTCKTIGGSKEILRMVNLIAELIAQLKEGKKSTLRNMYYVAMTWIEEARFEEVSDTADALEDLECLTGLLREEMGVVPDYSGSVFGPITVNAKTRSGVREIHCANDVSESGFAIPPRVEDYSIVTCDAKFVLVLETGGVYQRLIDDRLDQTLGAALIHTKGQSSRATRLCLAKIRAKRPDIPILGFHDGDCWGATIIENMATGSIKSSHLSQRLCTPDLKSIGLFPSQIIEYEIPSVKLTPREIKRVDELLDDPRYQMKEELMDQLRLMKSLKIKAEQQALAAKGSSFVTNVFLPDQLKKLNII